MRYFDLKDKKYYKVAKVLMETINIYVDYGKHIWIANGIKIIDILFMHFCLLKNDQFLSGSECFMKEWLL